MFLTNQDYEVVVGKTAMDVISRCSETVKANAEAEAQEEIACYLRPDYDTGALFAAEYGTRNPKIVQIAVDIALYHMASSLPQKMGMDIRKERYDAALDWLKGVRAGNLASREMEDPAKVPSSSVALWFFTTIGWPPSS